MHNKTRFFVTATLAALCTFSGALSAQNEPGEPPEMPPARAIPGITADDQFAGACVDCHINYAEMNLDTRLSTIMRRWSDRVDPAVLEAAQSLAGPEPVLTGVHPLVDSASDDIPAACLRCHESSVDGVIPLVPLIHKIHLAGGDKNVFLRIFQGECTHCHKLDQATGQWRVPSGPEK